MATQKQIDANRRNAQKSTGPKTPEGKRVVAANALRHGLTAESVVIPGEDPQQFEQLRDALRAEHQPVGPTQEILFQQLVVAAWRLRRCRCVEAALFEMFICDTEEEAEEEYSNVPQSARPGFAFRADAAGPNALANLSRYEARAERAFYRALHELQRLRREGTDSSVPSQARETDSLSPAPLDPPICQTNPIEEPPGTALPAEALAKTDSTVPAPPCPSVANPSISSRMT